MGENEKKKQLGKASRHQQLSKEGNGEESNEDKEEVKIN